MHKWAKEMLECVKARVEAIGIDNFEGQNLDDLKDWTEIAKNIVCFDKDYSIVEAMKEAENEDNIRMIELYEDYPERRYYDEYRYRNGRFAPKGRGTRRGYEEPPYYHMTPEMYREHDPEWYRDMDRINGRMYFTEPKMSDSVGRNDRNESRYDRAKRMYTETKNMHRANTAEDKQAKMRDLEEYAKEMTEDVIGMVSDMSDEEKNLLRVKLQTLVQKIQ